MENSEALNSWKRANFRLGLSDSGSDWTQNADSAQEDNRNRQQCPKSAGKNSSCKQNWIRTDAGTQLLYTGPND